MLEIIQLQNRETNGKMFTLIQVFYHPLHSEIDPQNNQNSWF